MNLGLGSMARRGFSAGGWSGLLVFALVLFSAACGTEVTRLPGSQSQLDLRVYTPPFQDAFAGVSTLRLELRFEDGSSLERVVDQSASEFLLDGAPATGVVLRLEGLDLDHQVVASGQSIPFDLIDGQTVQVDLLFARTGEFTRLLNGLNHARFGHTATATADGRVLVFGGAGAGDLDTPTQLAPPELYDPRQQVSCGFDNFECPTYPAADARFGHSATALEQGRVLVFGGRDGGGQLHPTALIYESDGAAFRVLSGIDPLRIRPRAHHAAAVMQFEDDGAGGFREGVLISGGEVEVGGQAQATNNSMLFDSGTEVFTDPDLVMFNSRMRHSVTVFGAERRLVLLAGGRSANGLLGPVELFNGRAFETVIPIGQGAAAGLASPRLNHVALEVDGEVLIVGGDDGLHSMDAPEKFVYSGGLGTGVFTLAVQAAHADHRLRTGSMPVVTPDGGMLMAGGEAWDGFERIQLDSSEVFLPEADSTDGSFFEAAPLGHALSFSSRARLPGGGLLFCGGLEPGPDGPVPSAQVWYYNPR